MNKRLQGFIAGILCCVLLAGVGVYAKSKTEMIEVLYNNIKVYKDNVLCELKDANGTVVEPFIYNGTTYMPVRGTANLADMEVTWDGATQSVYLWDEMVPEGTYLMDVCPPYSTSGFESYHSYNGNSFSMAGKKYSDGLAFTSSWTENVALFNLDSKYSEIECTVGHINEEDKEKTVSFIVNGKLIKKIELESQCMPKKISIPLEYGLQLKIIANTSHAYSGVGIGNITVK